ncbi:MAG: hypothetical protein MI807_16755 [Verrucomicrobiales bacterium]|nr:hypothetical protein [Verrucomicrobiales bacterium]
MWVFTSSIGRSGTRYLSEAVGNLSDIASFHLAEPYCNGEAFVRINEGEQVAELDEKLHQIKRDAAETGHYFESNPMFVRGFGETVLKSGNDFGVIQLLRDPMEVAKSYRNRDSYPGHPGRPWRLPLNTAKSLLRVEAGLTPYQENLVDWLENELRLHAFRDDSFPVTPLYFSELGNSEKIAAILSGFGVPVKEAARDSSELDRNENVIATDVEEQDWEEASTLLQILRGAAFSRDLFLDPVYDPFPFIGRLREEVV